MHSEPSRKRRATHRSIFRIPALLFFTLLLSVALVIGCQPKADSGSENSNAATGEATTTASRPVPEGAPKLVLLLVVDQMRGDYFERFASLLDGGLARLKREGVLYTNAHQDHSTTTTAPGHATIATGTYPATHGIVGNNWFDRTKGEEIYSVEDDEYGRSPLQLLVPTLGDRMKQSWPQSKVFAIGGKDRSTVLTAGREADGAYWYHSNTGTFTTSSYYNPKMAEAADSSDSDGRNSALPDWLNDFHAERWPDQFFGTSWTPLSNEKLTTAATELGIEALDRGEFSRTFPYAFGGFSMTPGRSFYSGIYGSPWMDTYVGRLAAALIENEGLGQDSIPDMLAVNFSATDAVGHTFGPDSPELADTILRLDATIGELLDAVDATVGLENVVIALSADHGVGQVPEVARTRGGDAARLSSDFALCLQRVGSTVGQRFQLEGTEWMPDLVYFDRQVLESKGVDYSEIQQAVAEGLSGCPRVERIVKPIDLESIAEDGTDDPILDLMQHSYRSDRSQDLLIHFQPNTLATTATASHGTAHRYDTWVPMLFWFPGQEGRTIADKASVTDIAPTIGSVLGLPESGYDGANRIEQVQDAAPQQNQD